MNLKALAIILAGTTLACAAEDTPVGFAPLTPISTQIASAVVKSNKSKTTKEQPKLRHWLIEAKPAYFIPQDPLFRDIYGNGGFIMLGEIGYFINKSVCVSLEGGYFHKHGTLTNVDISTKITQAPVSLLLKYIFNAEKKFNVYVKLGPNYLYSHEVINYPGFESETKHTFGATTGLGLVYNFCHGWLIDLFGNYRYDRRSAGNGDLDQSVYLGGFDLGLGLGYRF